MKKIFATLVVVCFVIASVSKVYALTPTNLEAGDNYNRNFISEVQDVSEVEFDDIVDFLEVHAKAHFSLTGEKITWAILSLNNHKHLQFCIFYDKGTEAYKELLSNIDDSIDFVQVGGIQYKESLEKTKEAFEADATKAALNAIIPIGTDSEAYKGPVYWEIKDDREDDEIYALEVAIGKYIIKKGDVLSQIADDNNTTVERLLEKNSNIEDPSKIYAGDYLVIK